MNLSEGFDVGESIFPWGTTLSEVAEHFPNADADQVSLAVLEQYAMGLSILSVTIKAPALDRPILSTEYQLKHESSCQSDDCIVAQVSSVLGEPTSCRELCIMGKPESGVRCFAEWDFGDFLAEMSIYGAPRQKEEGLCAGVLWVSWKDEIAAATPYIKELEEVDARLAHQAEDAVLLGIIPIQVKQDWYYRGGHSFRDLHLDWKNPILSKVRRALGRLQLRCTPSTIAKMLEKDELAVWKSDMHRVWCLSNREESVCFSLDAPTEVSYIDFLLAKGGGRTCFVIGPLQLSGSSKSESLSYLAGIMESHGLAIISYFEPYDC